MEMENRAVLKTRKEKAVAGALSALYLTVTQDSVLGELDMWILQV